uniref:Dickkopf WNT signaling pathway inhibitor 4 n=1 Tax=Erpetoichthys calabaricus TaxID=27687 RepID=A0A8C4RBB7_ERPCA
MRSDWTVGVVVNVGEEGGACQNLLAKSLVSRDLKLSLMGGTRCQVDSDCRSGNFCHKTSDKEPLCKVCHPLRRRCQRDAMCSGTALTLGIYFILNYIKQVQKVKGWVEVHSLTFKVWKKVKDFPFVFCLNVGQEGDNCLRTSDCAPGYCCARHFWDKICKRMPKEGEVCSKRGRKEVPQSHELFQRCECSPGLSCRLQSDNKDKQNSRLRVCLRPLEGSTKKEAGSSSKKLKRKRRH